MISCNIFVNNNSIIDDFVFFKPYTTCYPDKIALTVICAIDIEKHTIYMQDSSHKVSV